MATGTTVDRDPHTDDASAGVDLQRLRTLLLAPDRTMAQDILRSLTALRLQIHDPDRLTTLLLPVITDVLERKIATASAAVARTIAPIVDQAIVERSHEGSEALAHALAPLLRQALRQEAQINAEDLAAALAPVSTRAIAHHNAQHPGRAARDLAPMIGTAIKEQIRSERGAMVDALYPVIGSTIAKYMSETLSTLIRTVNEKIERGLSVRGIMRRIRSRVTGVSEAELLLRESVPSRVTALFLIQNPSGLVIAQAQHPGAGTLDSDLLSGMLTAIRGLMQESIVGNAPPSELDQIRYGQSTIVLESTGYCFLAAVVEGEADDDLKTDMRTALARIVQVHGSTFRTFDGDAASVPDALHNTLAGLLAGQDDPPPHPRRRIPWPLLIAAACLLLAILVPAVITWSRNREDRDLEHALQRAFAASAILRDDHLDVAVDRAEVSLSGSVPNAFVHGAALSLARSSSPGRTITDNIQIASSDPLPVLTEARIRGVMAAVNQIDDVSANAVVTQGVVTLSGEAEDSTVVAGIAEAIGRLPGVRSLANTMTVAEPVLRSRVYFERADTVLSPDQQQTVAHLARWLTDHPNRGLKAIGHIDPQGPDDVNRVIAAGRARSVARALALQGIPPERIVTIPELGEVPGVPASAPDHLKRCVRFESLPIQR